MRRFLLFFACVCLAVPASAQQLKLEISGGRVTLDANAVPARQILAEWARVGGTTVVGGDKITGAPLTLKLVDVPERQALDIVLRSVAGFMAATRQPASAPGASTYERILIMATSSAPPASAARVTTPAPNANANAGMAGTQRRVPPRPPNFPAPGEATVTDENVETDVTANMPPQPVFTFPGTSTPPPTGPIFVPVPNPNAPGNPTPSISLQPSQTGQPTIYNFVPSPNNAPVPPGQPQTGFGVVGSPQPGMIQQPAPPTPPGVRPPPRQ